MTTMVGTKSSMRSSGERGCDGSRPDVNDRKAPMSKYMTPMVKGDGGLPRRPPSSEVLPLPLWLLVVTMLLRVFCGCFSPGRAGGSDALLAGSQMDKKGENIFSFLNIFLKGSIRWTLVFRVSVKTGNPKYLFSSSGNPLSRFSCRPTCCWQ